VTSHMNNSIISISFTNFIKIYIILVLFTLLYYYYKMKDLLVCYSSKENILK